MSAGARALLALGMALGTGLSTACASRAPGDAPEGSARASASAAGIRAPSSAAVVSALTTTGGASAGASAPRAERVVPGDPVGAWLETASLVALATPRIAAGRLAGPNVLDAVAEEPASPGATSPSAASPARHRITLSLALLGAPSAHRRPLAYARLAQALGAHIVPVTIERHLGGGAIVALLEGQPLLHARLGMLLALENDGTVTALLSAPSPSALGDPWAQPVVTALHPTSSLPIKRWEGWAASPGPVAGESAQLTRDYVEMLALDYLAAHGTRRAVLYVPEREALILEDNRDAFPDHVQRSLVDPLLRRLRAVARFPRGLRDALARLDRPRAEALLHPGSFEDWLVSPRSLIELDERRAGLLSLIEAQIAQRGEAAVLSL